MNKKTAQAELDHLRKDKRSFQKGTEQFARRMRLEMILDTHLYDKEKKHE